MRRKAVLSVGRGLFAFADLDRGRPGLFVVAQAQAVARAATQVVEVAVGQSCQRMIQVERLNSAAYWVANPEGPAAIESKRADGTLIDRTRCNCPVVVIHQLAVGVPTAASRSLSSRSCWKRLLLRVRVV